MRVINARAITDRPYIVIKKCFRCPNGLVVGADSISARDLNHHRRGIHESPLRIDPSTHISHQILHTNWGAGNSARVGREISTHP